MQRLMESAASGSSVGNRPTSYAYFIEMGREVKTVYNLPSPNFHIEAGMEMQLNLESSRILPLMFWALLYKKKLIVSSVFIFYRL